MVTRRLVVAGLVSVAALAAGAGPARADDGLTVVPGAVTADRVELVADLPGAAGGELPPVTVSWNGQPLSATVRPDRAGPDRSVVVVLDTGTAAAGTLPAARDGVLGFAAAAPAELAIGLVSAAGTPAVVLPPTRDRAALRTAVAGLRAGGDPAIYAGLATAAGVGGGAADRRLLVVAANPDNSADADRIAGQLTSAKRRIDLVPVGAARGGLTRLRRAVAATGGTVRPAAAPGALPGALRAMAGTFPVRATISVAVPPELAGTETRLAVSVGAGADRASADVPVRIPALPSAAASAATGGGLRGLGLGLGPLTLLIFGLLVAAILLVVFAGGDSVRPGRLRQVERFRVAGGGVPITGDTGPNRAGPRRRPNRTGPPGPAERAGAQPDGEAEHGPNRLLWAAGCAVAGAILLGLLAGPLGLLLGAVLGWFVPALRRRTRERRRRRAFADQLPDALQLVVGSLKSGFSLGQSIDGVVRDAPPGPLAVELGRAMSEVRLGSDLDDALERTAERVGNEDLAWAVMAIRIQRETGGNLAEVLETAVETLRERDRLRRHVRALSAEGRLSAYVLIGLPFALAGWLLLTRRDYLAALWTTPLGLTMLIGAAVLMAVGTFWMSRWTKVEV
ncbi:type II secretion system F family protein [Plantactinospora siamensis]|uniref:Type II secretion system F family protein n=1 Tax=Plantactinospora siamensis TaxID=555372 RepID=A0ABV6NRH6_9ACTN